MNLMLQTNLGALRELYITKFAISSYLIYLSFLSSLTHVLEVSSLFSKYLVLSFFDLFDSITIK